VEVKVMNKNITDRFDDFGRNAPKVICFSTLIGGVLVPLRVFASGNMYEKTYDISRKDAFGKSKKSGRVRCSYQLLPASGPEGVPASSPEGVACNPL
jgi:hypothetical protein